MPQICPWRRQVLVAAADRWPAWRSGPHHTSWTHFSKVSRKWASISSIQNLPVSSSFPLMNIPIVTYFLHPESSIFFDLPLIDITFGSSRIFPSFLAFLCFTNLYINKTVEGLCLYIDYIFPILRFLSVSYKTKTIQVVFSFGVCLSVCLFVLWRNLWASSAMVLY